jgi:hypothetical protein
MPIDPSIVMGYRGLGELPNPMNQLAQASQIQSSQRQGEAAQMQLQQMRRDEAALTQFYSDVAKNGGPTTATEIENVMINSRVPSYVSAGMSAKAKRLGLENERKRLDAISRGESPDMPATAAPNALLAAQPMTPQGAPALVPTAAPAIAGEMPSAPASTPGQINQLLPDNTPVANAMVAQNDVQAQIAKLTRMRNAYENEDTPRSHARAATVQRDIDLLTKPHTQNVNGQVVERQPDGTYRVVFGEKKQLPIIELQAILAKMPLNDPNRPALEAEVNKAKVTQEQGAQRNRISLGQLNLGQSKFAWEQANPGYELKQDENGGWVGVNKRTLQTTPVTAPTTAPNAPSAAEVAVPAGQFKGRNQATASQEGAAYNANRILTSAKQIQSAVNKNAESNAPGLSEAVSSAVGLEGVSNLLRGPQRQIVAGAQADIIDSLLFLATGAAYNKEQLAQQRASYLPAYTDKPEALAAKQERLLGLITAVKSKSGSRWTKEMDDAVSSLRVNAAVPPPTTAKPPAAGAGVTVRDW